MSDTPTAAGKRKDLAAMGELVEECGGEKAASDNIGPTVKAFEGGKKILSRFIRH